MIDNYKKICSYEGYAGLHIWLRWVMNMAALG